eukprot:Sdes_comp20850_c0_seq1m17584
MNLFSLDPFNSLCPVQKSQEIITDFPQEDVILVTDLSVRTLSGVERWEREKKQNIIINLWIFCDTQSSAQQDSLACSFNYGIIAKTVTNYCEESSFKTLEALAFSIAKLCILENQVPKITVRVSKPCALIQAKCASVEITRTKADFVISSISPIKIQNYWDKIILQDLHVYAIVGINPWERVSKQNVYMNIILWADSQNMSEGLESDFLCSSAVNYRCIARETIQLVENSKYKTIEALIDSVARNIISKGNIPAITIRIDKPNALLFAHSAAIQITRTRNNYNA